MNIQCPKCQSTLKQASLKSHLKTERCTHVQLSREIFEKKLYPLQFYTNFGAATLMLFEDFSTLRSLHKNLETQFYIYPIYVNHLFGIFNKKFYRTNTPYTHEYLKHLIFRGFQVTNSFSSKSEEELWPKDFCLAFLKKLDENIELCDQAKTVYQLSGSGGLFYFGKEILGEA